MECNKWEEYGLLFTSGELENDERQSFEQHLKACSVCAQEHDAYRSVQNRFFTPETLEDSPSPACDAEILRVCSDGRRKVSGLHPMPLFIRRSVVSVALFVIGFIGVGYITLKTGAGNNRTGSVPVATDSSITSETVAGVTDGAAPNDSAADSSSEKGVNYSKTRGNLGLNGVYPVDLQNK